MDGPPAPASGCVIVCPMPLGRSAKAFRTALASSFVVAVDGGIDRMRSLGGEPDLWVGDGDSASAATLRRADCPRLVLPREKDYTDLEYALHAVGAAFLEGAWQGDVVLLGAQGGRFDHELGTMLAVGRWLEDLAAAVGPESCPIVCGVSDAGSWIATMKEARFRRARGRVFSVLAFGRSPRLTIRGAKYALKNRPLEHSTSGLSNEGLGGEVVVKVGKAGAASPCAVFVMIPESTAGR